MNRKTFASLFKSPLSLAAIRPDGSSVLRTFRSGGRVPRIYWPVAAPDVLMETLMFRQMFLAHSCPVCGGECEPYDVVDFHKSCAESAGRFLSLSGIPIYYFLCRECGFLFAPEFRHWSRRDFANYIYNKDYIHLDPDFATVRPRQNAQNLLGILPSPQGVRHLDYGGGEGELSRTLRAAGWDSTCYDPYAGSHQTVPRGARFDLITSFEVFEHVPDPHALLKELDGLLADRGLLIFSTMLSDGHLQRPNRIDWWYISPRNGHISIYAKASLEHLARRYGSRYCNPFPVTHVFWKQAPAWAEGFLAQWQAQA